MNLIDEEIQGQCGNLHCPVCVWGDLMKKTLLMCVTGAILQACVLTGCSDGKSKNTPESSRNASETSAVETGGAESGAVKNIVLPEMDMEDDTFETLPTGAVQSDKAVKADKSNNDNKAVTTRVVTTRKETVTTKAAATYKESVTATKTPAKNTTPNITTKKTSREEITTKAVTTAVTAATKIDIIELPEVEFD